MMYDHKSVANRILKIESQYLGSMNCADYLYQCTDYEIIRKIILGICEILIKIDIYQYDKHYPNDLRIGIDTGIYNFMPYNNLIYYVDHYPPRNRFDKKGNRRRDDEVITDYPAPRNEKHGRHLLHCFYTRTGMWTHALGHIFSAIDCNLNFRFEKKIDLKIWTEIMNFLIVNKLEESVEQLNEKAIKEEFDEYRLRFRNHIIRYYHMTNIKGYNLSQLNVKGNKINKYYMFNKDKNKFFNHREAEFIKNECERYYNTLVDIGIRTPHTRFVIEKGIRSIIIASGIGERLGLNKPKTFCCVNNKPISDYIIDECKSAFTYNINICVSEETEGDILDHFKNKHPSLNTDFFKADRRGVGYAIKEALKKCMKNKQYKRVPVIISVSDVFTINQVSKIRDSLIKTNNTLIICVASKQIINEKKYTYAYINPENKKLTIVNEGCHPLAKPIIGIYAFTGDVTQKLYEILDDTINKFENGDISRKQAVTQGIINEDGEFRLSFVFNKLDGVKIKLIDIDSFWEVNTPSDLIRTEDELNQRNNSLEFFFTIHSMLLVLANNSVKRESVNTVKDFWKPVVHITSQSYWINDPNGACYYKGKYHLFFQHNPYHEKWGNISWGHVISDDLVFWEYMPIALTPQPEIDEGGVFSGCCVITDKNVPLIFYTGIKKKNIAYHDVQLKEQYQFCAASMDDKLEIWKKYPSPIILPPDDIAEILVDCFRDPFVWKENTNWYMLIGTGVENKGGNALLYRSSDLMLWRRIGFLCDNFEGTNWECCNLFRLKDKYILIISPEYISSKDSTTQKEHKYTLYSIGDFDIERGKFKPDCDDWKILDLGGSDAFCAPHTFKDQDNNRILWGWINTDNKGGYKWNGVISLPRILELNNRNELMVKPLPALSKLRIAENPLPEVNAVLKSDSKNVLDFLNGSVLELVISIENFKDLGKFIFSVISDDIYEIEYDHSEKKIKIEDTIAELDAFFVPRKFHIFIDKSVIELYINDKYCMTRYLQLNSQKNYNFALKISGNHAELTTNIKCWNLRTVWN